MRLDIASLLVNDATQLPLHRFERIVNHLGKRLVRAVIHLLLVGDELVAARDRNINATTIGISFLMGTIGLLDGDVAAIDVIAKFFEPRGVSQNEMVDLF